MFTSLASPSLPSPPQTMMNDTATFNLMRCPFTPSQWQELEHQALIFKYMASGRPVPPDLLLPFKRVTPTFMVDSPTPSIFPHHQPNIGWGCFQMGYGKSRAEDPEPGRCRRTDGKKWRCSKEAHPDSKYCERHMHRGKNRSRKHVEATTKTTTNNTASFPMLASDPIPHHPYQYKPAHFSPQPQPSPTNVDLRCGFTPLGLCSDSRKGEGGGDGKETEHCFVLGADLVKHSQREEDGECPRTLRRFFDEWPLMKEGEVEEAEEEERSSSSSRNQLSISTPLASCHHLSLR